MQFLLLIFVCGFFHTTKCEIRAKNCNLEGALVKSLGQLYLCEDNRLNLIGCVTDFGKPVKLGETYFSQDYEWACNKVTDHWNQLVPLVCWYKGTAIQLEEVYVEQPFWFTCKVVRGSNRLEARLVPSGCVTGQSDEKLTHGDNFQSGPYIFTCNRYGNGSLRIEPAACVYNNEQVLLDQELEHPNYAFKCSRSRNSIGIEFGASSCMFNGTRYPPGKQYVKNGFVFQCHLSGNRMSHTMVGCVDSSDRWYSPGEQWILGTGALRYVTECVIMNDKRKAVKVAVQCLYSGPDGPTVIHPGCMKRFNSTLIQCVKLADNGSIEFRVTNYAKVHEKHALNMGIRFC